MDGPIASAVVLPEELQAPASPSHKRRNSSITDDNPKRPRLDDDHETSDRRGSAAETQPAVPVRRERGRERRLFGAVLGALSQNTATAGQKRRAEIEKRQQARRQSENEEGEQRKAERIARRREQRWREQKHFERASMRTRHENLRSMARFLKTETEPCLYYKPWETSPEEEERIQDQIAEAEDTIKREVEDFEAHQRQDSSRNQRDSEEAIRNAEGSRTSKDRDADAPRKPSTTNGRTKDSTNSPKDLEMKDDHAQSPGTEAVRDERATKLVHDSSIPSHETVADDAKDNDDENGEDIVEEAAEDTVIY